MDVDASIGVMNVMDRTGHTKVSWDRNVPAEVAHARATFNDMTGQGYRAFKVAAGGGQGAPMTSFDPAAESIMLVPHLVGG